ncbi:MAG: hypothetical protein WA126_11125 [Thermodesulfovibrionales bacterium]
MNINETILSDLGEVEYCGKDKIINFINEKNFKKRQEAAIKIIERLLKAHGKEGLLGCLADLAEVEHAIRELQWWVRDHVVHALLTHILGLYINEKWLTPTQGICVDSFQWRLASLMHDIAYPSEVGINIMNRLSDKINELKEIHGISNNKVGFLVTPIGFDELENNRNSFDLIQDRIAEWELSIDVRKEYDDTIKSGRICHGMISALSVLQVIDSLYQKYNPKRELKEIKSNGLDWNQRYFNDDVVSACTAIYIHNLPIKCFQKGKIDCTKAPLGFLLKLADCLQEWERPSQKNPKGYSSDKFDIYVTDDSKLVLSADIPKNRKDEINIEITSCLEKPYVEVV